MLFEIDGLGKPVSGRLPSFRIAPRGATDESAATCPAITAIRIVDRYPDLPEHYLTPAIARTCLP